VEVAVDIWKTLVRRPVAPAVHAAAMKTESAKNICFFAQVLGVDNQHF
jgi:hypothetical protein